MLEEENKKNRFVSIILADLSEMVNLMHKKMSKHSGIFVAVLDVATKVLEAEEELGTAPWWTQPVPDSSNGPTTEHR